MSENCCKNQLQNNNNFNLKNKNFNQQLNECKEECSSLEGYLFMKCQSGSNLFFNFFLFYYKFYNYILF